MDGFDMKIVKKYMAAVVVLMCILNLLAPSVCAEDIEGWRKTLVIEDPIYDTAAIVSINITKKVEASYAIQFMTSADDGAVKTLASIRLSAAGKLLFRNNGGWISVSDENSASLIRADFAANTNYTLKMKFTIRSGLIEWYLGDEKIGESVTSVTGKPCEHIRLLSTAADMNNLEWSLESVIGGNENTAVLARYAPEYTGAQGTNNWYFCEYGIEEIRNLTLSSDGKKWIGDGNYPFINRVNNDIMPANELAVGFTFTSPGTGMVRLKGTVTLPYQASINADVTASIYKGRKEIWSGKAAYLDDAVYYYTIPLKKGEELHFKVDSNGSNSCDWTHWIPTVEYLNIEYTPEDEIYTFFQKKNGTVKELTYDNTSEGYFADDGVAFIGYTAVRPSAEYAVGKRYTVQTNGRHRVFGKFGATDKKMEVAVLKNQEVIWEQLLPQGEMGVLDVRVLSEVNDIIDIVVSACDGTPSECAVEDLYIEYHVGTAFCKASTGVGYSYNTLEEVSLGDLVTNPGDTKVDFYSSRFARSLPMTYDEDSEKWVSSIEGDPGYISAEAVYPGKHYDSVMEITVPKSGIIRIDGDMPVRDISDGVVSRISINGKVIWSSRIGGERPVRWDESFDVSYFLNSVGVAARVKKGDKLAFSFNQWRLTDNDKVDISDVKLKYISGDVLSETTKWKLDKSAVVDTKNKTVQTAGVSENLDLVMRRDTTYIVRADLSKVFGTGFTSSETPLVLNGKEYLPLRSVAESAGKTVVWAADGLALIHDGIPVLFGWTELSEIAVAYSSDSSSEIYGCFDTYENGTTPSVSLNGSNSDIQYNSMGGLKPNAGYAEIAEQSNAVVLEYSGNANINSNTSQIKIGEYADESNVNVVGLDVFIPSPCGFVFSLLNDEGEQGAQFLISSNGWIGPCYGKDVNISGNVDTWINRSLSDVLSDSQFTGAQFDFGKWNNIKLITDIPNRSYYLYLNGILVQTVENADLQSQSMEWNMSSLDSLQITNYSAKDGMKITLYLDNLTVGTVEEFSADSELGEDALSAMNVTLSETFEEDDAQDILLAWTGDNQLRPLGGSAKILEQSNAARIFSGKQGEDVEYIRFDIRNYVGDGSMPVVIEFDVNLFSDGIFVFSDRKYWGYGQQAVVSPNGYIAAAYGQWIDNDDQHAAMRAFAARTRSEQAAKGVETADFALNTWHNVKMVYENSGTKRSLYIDGDLVYIWKKDAVSALEAFQITILTGENNQVGNALFDIDNLKIARLNRFEVSSLYPENQTGKRIENFVAGETCYVKLSAENNNTFEESIQLVIAQYDSENALIDIFLPEKLSVRESGGELDIDYASKEDAVSFKALDNAEKIMIAAWNGTDELKPLIEAVRIFSKTEQEKNEDSILQDGEMRGT